MTAIALASVIPFAVSAAPASDTAKSNSQAAPTSFEPFPADQSIHQSAVIAGRKIDYVTTAGSVKLYDAAGNATGEVFFVAYTMPGQAPGSRPVTFSFNGGPGASQIALNLGGIGPKRVDTGTQGATPSDTAITHDNPNSWLDFTDLVFIDPIGTGYSRSLLGEDATKKTFLTADTDIHYLSEVIYQWLRRNGRMTSPKYLIGESYGGYRVPRLAEYLQNQIGVGVAGITMVSPALSDATADRDGFSPIAEMIFLPSEAAAHFEAQGKPLSDALIQPVEDYARSEFIGDLLAGPRDKAATDRLTAKVAELTGLDPALVRQENGRVSASFVRDYRRKEGKIGSFYDANVTTYDPFPAQTQPDYDDPILGTEAPREEAMVDLVDRQVGWKVNARYIANNYDLNRMFEREKSNSAAADLRKAIANDPKMHVLISHGWNDFACPFFASQLIINQLPSYGGQDRVQLRVYPGGHMFYDRSGSAAAWRRDAMAMYSK